MSSPHFAAHWHITRQVSSNVLHAERNLAPANLHKLRHNPFVLLLDHDLYVGSSSSAVTIAIISNDWHCITSKLASESQSSSPTGK